MYRDRGALRMMGDYKLLLEGSENSVTAHNGA